MKENFFGTDGIRNTIGKFPLQFNTLPALGRAIGQWAFDKFGKSASILIAHDTRVSCALVKSSLKAGILLCGHTLYDAFIAPTPTVCLLTQEQDFDLGIVISASHNPYQDNGIKIITKSGKISPVDEDSIQGLYYELANSGNIDYSSLGKEYFYDSAMHYKNFLHSCFSTKFLEGLTVVLDCAHGATYKIAPDIFRSFGATVISLNDEPNGTNINHECGSLKPTSLQNKVIEVNADIGFAFDGDGDRVIACNKSGEIKDGDDLLAILLSHTTYKHSQLVVGTIMSNQGFERLNVNNNRTFLRTKVGDKYVLESLQANNALVGGEPSGHIILRDYMNSGDGIFTALRVIEAIQQSNNWDLKTFDRFPQLIVNLPVKKKIDLAKQSVTNLITQHTKQLTHGRIVVRYSGTENILRVMVESADLTEAQQVTQHLTESLKYEHNLALQGNV